MGISSKPSNIVSSISSASGLAIKASRILQASGQPGMYGSHRLAAAIYNEMFGTVWTEDNPSTVEGQLAQVYVEKAVKSNLPQPRSNLSKDWGDMKKYGKKVASIMSELENRKIGVNVKELYRRVM